MIHQGEQHTSVMAASYIHEWVQALAGLLLIQLPTCVSGKASAGGQGAWTSAILMGDRLDPGSWFQSGPDAVVISM